MPISDIYTGRSATLATPTVGFSLATTTQTPFLSVFGTAAKRLWVVGVRVELGVTAAVAGNSIQFLLARSSTATVTGTGLASGYAHDPTAPASIGQFGTTYSTAPATLSAVVWEQSLPQTTGSAWEEFPPLGYEWGVANIASGTTNCGLHLFALASVSTATPLFADLIWSE